MPLYKSINVNSVHHLTVILNYSFIEEDDDDTKCLLDKQVEEALLFNDVEVSVRLIVIYCI